MTNEILHSAGASDDWHTPLQLLNEAVTDHGVATNVDGTLAYSMQTLTRLAALDVLQTEQYGDGGELLRWRASDAMRDVVQFVREPGPWHTALRALLDDERADVVPLSSSSASDATIEQTKLIAHEVRNALIPVRHDLTALRSSVSDAPQQRRIDDARGGVLRVLDFVEAMVQASEVITEHPSRVDVVTLVDEALGWSDASRRVELLAVERGIQVVAPRNRLMRAISNVIGNALQATPTGRPVRVSTGRGTGIVRIAVDDGGPGIPSEHRQRVFLDGVTMRKDGTGSGFGLAFARRVVEDALHGRIWCEDSDLGGARFVIEIPEPSPE